MQRAKVTLDQLGRVHSPGNGQEDAPQQVSTTQQWFHGVTYLLHAKQSFGRESLSSVFPPRGTGHLFLLWPGSSSVDLSSSGMLKMRGLAEVACWRRGVKRGGVG